MRNSSPRFDNVSLNGRSNGQEPFSKHLPNLRQTNDRKPQYSAKLEPSINERTNSLALGKNRSLELKMHPILRPLFVRKISRFSIFSFQITCSLWREWIFRRRTGRIESNSVRSGLLAFYHCYVRPHECTHFIQQAFIFNAYSHPLLLPEVYI